MYVPRGAATAARAPKNAFTHLTAAGTEQRNFSLRWLGGWANKLFVGVDN